MKKLTTIYAQVYHKIYINCEEKGSGTELQHLRN